MTDEQPGSGPPGGLWQGGATRWFLPREVFEEAHRHLRDDLNARCDALTARVAALEADQAERRRRQWALTLTVLSALALPLILSGILALVALRH